METKRAARTSIENRERDVVGHVTGSSTTLSAFTFIYLFHYFNSKYKRRACPYQKGTNILQVQFKSYPYFLAKTHRIPFSKQSHYFFLYLSKSSTNYYMNKFLLSISNPYQSYSRNSKQSPHLILSTRTSHTVPRSYGTSRVLRITCLLNLSIPSKQSNFYSKQSHYFKLITFASLTHFQATRTIIVKRGPSHSYAPSNRRSMVNHSINCLTNHSSHSLSFSSLNSIIRSKAPINISLYIRRHKTTSARAYGRTKLRSARLLESHSNLTFFSLNSHL